MKTLLIIILPMMCSLAKAQLSKSALISPDKKYHVEIGQVKVQNGGNPFAYDVIRVFRGKSKISECPLNRTETESPRSVYDCKWSPDSRFFVSLNLNVHGSSIWHSPTTVYDTVTNKFIDLDNKIGAVVDDHVEFSNPDSLKIKVLGPDGADGNPLVKEVSLTKIAEQK